MDIETAGRALGALAQPHRLRAFRLLVQAGPEGMAAGAIARALSVPHNTLSTHLGILANAGLVLSRRAGRSVLYRLDVDGTRALLGFLVQDCCQGSIETCAPLLDDLLAPCCENTLEESQ